MKPNYNKIHNKSWSSEQSVGMVHSHTRSSLWKPHQYKHSQEFIGENYRSAGTFFVFQTLNKL